MQRDQLAGADLLEPHPAHQPPGADAGEGDAVAVVGVHVRLDLEHQRGQPPLGRIHRPDIGRLRARRRTVFGEAREQVGDADPLDRGAEIHRREVPLQEALPIECRQRRADQIDVLAQRDEAWIGLREIGVQPQLAGAQIVGAGEIRRAPDRPCHRRGVERQCRRDFVKQLEDIAALAVHLVDECDDRDVAQAANLEQLAGARLDALGGVDHHHRGIHCCQRAVGVLGEVLVARRVEQVEHAARRARTSSRMSRPRCRGRARSPSSPTACGAARPWRAPSRRAGSPRRRAGSARSAWSCPRPGGR